MSEFSMYACYAALRAGLDGESLLYACLRMVCALISERKYGTIDVSTLSIDFEARFHFRIPYHPMVSILKLGLPGGLFFFNSQTGIFVPNYEQIRCEDYMSIVVAQDKKYQDLLSAFSCFLQRTYKLFVSNDEVSEYVQSFIEKHGITFGQNRAVAEQAKRDYYFADYLVECESNGLTGALDYVDAITVGRALADYIAFNEVDEQRVRPNTSVFLDTGIVFKLLGITSANCSDDYRQFIREMQKSGMNVCIFRHTYDEFLNLVSQSEQWIGNNNYDPSIATECTSFFVSHRWSQGRVRDLVATARVLLERNLDINIVEMDYPKVDDIRTPFEADIHGKLIQQYSSLGRGWSTMEKRRNIEFDAKSLFFTLHRNAGSIPYSLGDVRNIFITTNRVLEMVGYALMSESGIVDSRIIPCCMTDINWGTMLWVNNPVKISQLNRARLISEAYAAFKPSSAIFAKMSNQLSSLSEEEKETLTPEVCYMLKTSPVAHHLLSRKTQNREEDYLDRTPFEIIQEIQQDAYQRGCDDAARQVEAIRQDAENEKQGYALEVQRSVIDSIEKELMRVGALIGAEDELLRVFRKEGDRLGGIKEVLTELRKKQKKIFQGTTLLFSIFYIITGFWLHAQELGWVVDMIALSVPVIAFAFAMVAQKTISPLVVIKSFDTWNWNRLCIQHDFDENALQKVNGQECEHEGKRAQLIEEKEKLVLRLREGTLTVEDQLYSNELVQTELVGC